MTPEKIVEVLEAVKVVALRPSDILVLRCSKAISKAQEVSIKEYLEEETGHTRIIILDTTADLGVLRPEPEPRFGFLGRLFRGG